MMALQRLVTTVALVALLAASAGAEMTVPAERQSLPGAAAVAMFSNLVYVPIRFAVTVVSAELGGLTGFLTGGNKANAEDIWGVFDGQAILTRPMVQGEEPVRFGRYEHSIYLITPGY